VERRKDSKFIDDLSHPRTIVKDINMAVYGREWDEEDEDDSYIDISEEYY